MNQPDDYYGAIIRQRAAAEAADLLADECRKKDAALVQLASRPREESEMKRDHEHVPGWGCAVCCPHCGKVLARKHPGGRCPAKLNA